MSENLESLAPLEVTIVYSKSFSIPAKDLPDGWSSLPDGEKQDWLWNFANKEMEEDNFDGPCITDCSEEDLIE